MPSVSSLLKSAQSTQKKIRTQQDALAAFEWENSAQTYDDFIEYSKYLEDNKSKVSDVSEILSYETKIRSARRSFTSNEIQRAQMAIMEGRAGTQDKMNSVQELYYQAVDNGDFNLAQNLISQWDGLSIKLQNEQEANAKAFASSSKKAKDTFVNDLTKGFDDVTLPNGQKVTPLAAIARDLEETGGSTETWQAASDTLEAIRNTIVDQYNTASSQEEIDALETKYGPGLADIDEAVYFSVGGKKLSLQEVVNAEANEALNNPIYGLKAEYNEATGQNEFKLKPNNVERIDYVRQFDEQGNEYFVPAQVRTSQDKLFFGGSDQGRSLSTQITDAGEIIGAEGEGGTGSVRAGEAQVRRSIEQSISERLKALGVEAKTNGTTLVITLPGESVERTATIQPDGSIRFYGDDGQVMEFGVVDRNLGTDVAPQIFRAGQMRAVSPEEVSDFGTASAFGGTLSKASAQGGRYLADITGRTQAAPGNLAGPIRIGNDFSGFGTAVTSSLLQSASATRATIQQQQARQAMLQAQMDAATKLQASPTFNLNQVPVQQLTGQGILKRQLQVAAPTPTPRVVVAPAAPTPRIGSVGVAAPTNRVSVGAARQQPRLTVR